MKKDGAPPVTWKAVIWRGKVAKAAAEFKLPSAFMPSCHRAPACTTNSSVMFVLEETTKSDRAGSLTDVCPTATPAPNLPASNCSSRKNPPRPVLGSTGTCSTGSDKPWRSTRDTLPVATGA